MKTTFPEDHPQFYTATIYEWKHLLTDYKHKDIIVDCLTFLVNNKRIILNAFVIMNNHIHLIWQPMFGFTPSDIQTSFMKRTAKQLKYSLTQNNILAEFKVNKYDRDYQIWKREPLSIELRTHEVFMQKPEYIHCNPVRAGICINPEDYYYSSAKFYYDGTNDFSILTHYSGN